MTVSVLIPVYNEVGTLPLVIEKVLALPEISEIVVVDDGSKDGTREFLKTYSKPRVKVFFHETNLGKTGAINTALGLATSEIFIIQDADLEYDPSEIHGILAPILSGDADVVYGSRFMVRKTTRVLYFYNYLANKFLTFLSNLFTNHNMTDIETGYKAFKSFFFKGLGLTSKGFGMEVEITAVVCKTGARIYEVPISYYGRTYEEGKKIGFKDGLQAIFYIFYYNLIYVHSKAVRSHLAHIRRNHLR